jgi:aminoglycoside phosphotransferase (APT) family kinase protein
MASKNIHGQETEDLRQEIDIEALSSKLLKELPFLQAPLRIKQFKLGQSNPTFLVIGENSKIVIRKQPAGALISASAHRLDR